jgi:D-glycero-D-manno-heptose 1,7-bisphosphate phosphatase
MSERFGLGLTGVPAIGDSLRDLQAAAAVDALPVLVLTGKGKVTQLEEQLPPNTRIFPDLAAAADALAR